MDSELKPDELTLHLIATGLVEIRKITDSGKSLSYPYPAPFQRGWSRFVAACLHHKVDPPVGIDEFFSWCYERPLSEWPLALSKDQFGPGDKLIDGPFLTETCEEWAFANPDVEAELTENHIMEAAIQICRAKRIPESYAAFRRLLIKRLVLAKNEMDEYRAAPLFAALSTQLAEAYLEAPFSLIIKGKYYGCPSCGGLLQFVNNTYVCEEDRCRAKGNIKTPAYSLDAGKEPLLYLKRGLRRSVAIPGQTEVFLEEKLKKLGFTVEMWPGVEAYDLRVVFSNSDEVWALEVKDWGSPFWLARKVEPFPSTPSWTRAFFVFPDERRRERSDYRRAFDNNCPVLSQQTNVSSIFAGDLIRLAKEQLNA